MGGGTTDLAEPPKCGLFDEGFVSIARFKNKIQEIVTIALPGSQEQVLVE